MSTARAIAQEVRKLSEQAAALTRRHVLGIVLEGLSEPPPGGAALGKGEYARFIGGVPEHRAAALEALRGGGTLPAKDGVVWHYRPGIADFIRGGLTHREYAAFGARGDGKTGGVPAVMAWHA